MKSCPILLISLFSLCAFLPVSAQQLKAPGTPADPVAAAIEAFHRNKKNHPNEVSVVLPPPDEPAPQNDPAPEKTPADSNDKPVLVTGTPPENAQLVHPPSPLSPSHAPQKKDNLIVRVEKVKTGEGLIDPRKVEIAAPFPAKPIGTPPPGWKLENPAEITPVLREIPLSPDAKIHLNIRPHVLVPESDGLSAFAIREPGYDPAAGYEQTATVGAILSRSLRQMEDDAKQLGQVIDQLEQLVISLPKPPDPASAEPPQPARRK